MRSREEIWEEVVLSNAENNGNDTIALLQLEVLLDIRYQNIYETHWGVYCPQHFGSWDCDPTGRIYTFPSREIAEAHMEIMKATLPFVEKHLYEAAEIGKQKYLDPNKTPAGSVLCPVRISPDSC